MITSRIVVLFLFAIPAFAGNPYSGKWKFGAHLGANFSTASIDPDIAAQGGTKSGRTDFVGGFSAQYSICDRLSVGTELKYMQYGYKFEDTQTLGAQQFSRKEDIRVNYLELPVLGNYSIVDGELAFAAFFGPFFGFRFCSEEESSFTFGTTTTTKRDRREITSKMQFGLTGGLAAEFKIGDRLGIRADARYNLGLSNIYKSPANFTPPANYTEPTVKYRSLNLNAGIVYTFE